MDGDWRADLEGTVIHGGSMNQSSTHKTVQIKNIQHIFWKTRDLHNAHKISVFTKLLSQTSQSIQALHLSPGSIIKISAMLL